MSEVSVDYFCQEYLKALEQGSAALFAGAGLSQPSGFVNWKELMREIADELGLSVDEETDLISIAQFHVNKFGSRVKLNSSLIEEFTKDAQPNDNHRLIADLPIDTVWTTNYDTLIEDAFATSGKRVDKKTTNANLAQTKLNRDVILYKMHGDVDQPQNAVLTKDDYENYGETQALFSTKLQGDLISRTFLFLGFSFTDPNIEYILSRIRVLIGQQNQRQHFCIMKRISKPKSKGKALARYEYDKTKQELSIGDLRRFGIQTVMINDYSEVTAILRALHRDVYRRSLFVAGSAHDYEPLGRTRVEELSHTIGREIIRRGYNLVSGFGLGIGGSAVLGALEELYAKQSAISANHRTVIRPFPQDVPRSTNLGELWRKYREDMIGKSGFVIFLSGNKCDEASGQTVIADGVIDEWQIARRSGKYPLPVGATGHAAQQIWHEVNNSLDTFFPTGGVRGHFKTLGDENSSNEEIIEAIFAIVKRIAK
jgi:hypothetical protein